MAEPKDTTGTLDAEPPSDSLSMSVSASHSRDSPSLPGNETLGEAQDVQARIEAGDATVVPQLMAKLKLSDDKLMARLLVRVISNLCESEHLRALSKFYRHHDTHVRLWTLAAIARHEHHEYYPLILHGFFFDESKRIRSACRRTLRKLTPEQLELLVSSMELNRSPWMREAAELARAQLMDAAPIKIPRRAVSSSQELNIEALKGADLGPLDESYEAPKDPDEDSLVVSAVQPNPQEVDPADEDPRAKRLGIAEAIAAQSVDPKDRTFSRRDCPDCGERIMVEALLCRYCHVVFEPDDLERVMELAKVKLVPLAVRSPSHRGSALVVDIFMSFLTLPIGGIGLLYLFLKDALPGGQSLGKRMYGLKVVEAESGEPCTLRQSFARNAWLLVPFMPMSELVQLASSGMRFGDRFAETRVVFDDDPPATAILASATMFGLSVLALVVVLLFKASQGISW